MKTACLGALGLCEHCGALVSMEGMPAEAADANWACPKCRGELTHLSFGYDRDDEKSKKVRWVGPNAKWVDLEPTEDFMLGDLQVFVQPVRFIY